MRCMRTAMAVAASALFLIGTVDRRAAIARADDAPPAAPLPAAAAASSPAAARQPEASAAIDAERAQRARAFVAEHQPELAALLDSLEQRKPADHAAAVADLDASVRALAASRAKDERLYELELRAWQARTRIDLLVARRVAGSKKARAKLDADIREAVAAEIDVRAEQLAYRKQRSAAWYDRQIARLRDKRDELIADRLEALLVEPGRKQKTAADDGR